MAHAMLLLLGSIVLASASVASATEIPIATFDGAKATTLKWQPVNDPVMGGKSSSEFTVDSDRNLGVWKGEVRIVPSLQAPGFCNLVSPGLFKTEELPDLSGTDGIVARMREASTAGLTNFSLTLESKGARHFFKQGSYSVPAGFEVSSQMSEYFVPWSAFTCTWRGQKVSWCPDLKTQLKKLSSISITTAFPGKAGPFELQISSLSAKSSSLLENSVTYLDLATFDGGKSQRKWHTENDPVMGGRSSSAFQMNEGYGDYAGTCRIVPALKAPGFTIAVTETPLVAKLFPNVAFFDGLTLGVRNVGGDVSNFKLAFCASRKFTDCQFKSFKADISISQSTDPTNADFIDVFVPWSKFSDKWSSTTGKHTAEEPPTGNDLKAISQLQIWTEGVAGDFHLQIKYVRASKAPSQAMVLV